MGYPNYLNYYRGKRYKAKEEYVVENSPEAEQYASIPDIARQYLQQLGIAQPSTETCTQYKIAHRLHRGIEVRHLPNVVMIRSATSVKKKVIPLAVGLAYLTWVDEFLSQKENGEAESTDLSRTEGFTRNKDIQPVLPSNEGADGALESSSLQWHQTRKKLRQMEESLMRLESRVDRLTVGIERLYRGWFGRDIDADENPDNPDPPSGGQQPLHRPFQDKDHQ